MIRLRGSGGLCGDRAIYKFDRFPCPTGTTGSESFLLPPAIVGTKAGDNYYWDLPVSPLEGGRLHPRPVRVHRSQIRESWFTNDDIRQRYGFRITEKTINFTLKP